MQPPSALRAGLENPRAASTHPPRAESWRGCDRDPSRPCPHAAPDGDQPGLPPAAESVGVLPERPRGGLVRDAGDRTQSRGGCRHTSPRTYRRGSRAMSGTRKRNDGDRNSDCSSCSSTTDRDRTGPGGCNGRSGSRDGLRWRGSAPAHRHRHRPAQPRGSPDPRMRPTGHRRR